MSTNDPNTRTMALQEAFDLALQHHQAGRLHEAERLYRQILEVQPNQTDAMDLLGIIESQNGRQQAALELISQAITINPRSARYQNDLGLVLVNLGRLQDAVAAYRTALELNPDDADAHCNLGAALQKLDRMDEAMAEWRTAITLKPDHSRAYCNLGAALLLQQRTDEAIAALKSALTFNPNYAEAHSNLGIALRDKGQLEEAIAAYRQAIALRPDYAEAHSNLGVALTDKGQLDKALAAHHQALALKPDFANAHFNLSSTLLMGGNFKRGWEENEWRWKCEDFPSPTRNFPQPQWDGGPLEARTLLLHAEQGLGDAIQFIRYVPMVAQRGGKIIIECHAELQRLFQTMSEQCQIVVRGSPLPAFDLHCPLLSLPLVFGTTLENIPNTVPYLYADVREAKRWRRRLEDQLPIMKIGLVWEGNLKPNRNRAIRLSGLAPLGQVSGVRFYSLQKGEAAAQARTPPTGMELVDWTDELKDFADTAALIANLDLVITVDTAVAHLAGAMGKPVWTMLSFVADWRWLLQREDSPWYPTMRLFRQSVIGDWDSVIKRVVAALNLWIKNRE